MATARDDFACQVVDSLSSGVVGIDRRGLVVLYNPGAVRLLGMPPGGALGRPVGEALAAQPRLQALLIAALDGRPPVSRAEVALSGRPAGRIAGFTLNAVRDVAGDVTGAVLLLRDLTPFERSDERERLQERLAALGQMAAGMAHEIRNPLAGMEVIAGLLRRRLSGEGRELADELSELIESVAATVTASLDFVRPLEPCQERIDVADMLDAALQRGTARSPVAVTVERELASPLPELVGDSELLTGALANLVANACESMASGDAADAAHLLLRVHGTRNLHSDPREPVGELDAPTVRGVSDRPELVIRVEDNGPGIPESDRERIFYPFYTTKEQGSGIGLAQAQKVAMAHGGSIELATSRSDLARGAVFQLHLPAVAGC